MSSILIVEDEVLAGEYLEFVLREAGYEAILAGSAEEAIMVLEHRDDVHLVVTDINLPGGRRFSLPALWLGRSQACLGLSRTLYLLAVIHVLMGIVQSSPLRRRCRSGKLAPFWACR
jgi:CheY-like chemotaxis protein